jgi:hypothetical protein
MRLDSLAESADIHAQLSESVRQKAPQMLRDRIDLDFS